jgi:large subunit ribosomal protein L9e
MPKPIITSSQVTIPDNVEVTVVSRHVTVKGPRGVLSKNFNHVPVDMYLTKTEDGKNILKVDVWFGRKKTIASVRTVCSHTSNMIAGVTNGFRYTMRFVYAHFPINATIDGKGKTLEIRNFLGEKRVRRVEALEDTKIVRSADVKDQLVLEGNNIEAVSRTCALIHQQCLVKNKDIRKFLDGIYVESKGEMKDE